MAAETARYWQHAAVPGVDLLRARFVTHRYNRHAHETYTLGLIEAGVEEFEYGGTLQRAGQAGSPAGWAYRVLYPAVDVVTGVAAELGWTRGMPYFPETVVYDERSGRLLRAAHVAAECGDRLASSTLLRTALAGLLTAHARPVPQAGQPPAVRGRAPAAVTAARDLLAVRLADPP